MAKNDKKNNSKSSGRKKKVGGITMKWINRDELKFGGVRPEEEADSSEVDVMAEVVREFGLLVPVLVVKDGEKYTVLDGRKRIKAAYIVGLDLIPCVIIPPVDKVVAAATLVHGAWPHHRDDFKVGALCKVAIAKGVANVGRLARMLGLTEGQIGTRIRSDTFRALVIQAVRDWGVDFDVAAEVERLPTLDQQRRLLSIAARSGATPGVMRGWVEDTLQSRTLTQPEEAPEVRGHENRDGWGGGMPGSDEAMDAKTDDQVLEEAAAAESGITLPPVPAPETHGPGAVVCDGCGRDAVRVAGEPGVICDTCKKMLQQMIGTMDAWVNTAFPGD